MTRSASKGAPAEQPLLSPLSPGSTQRRGRSRSTGASSPAATPKEAQPTPGLSPLRRVTRSISADVPLIALSPLEQPPPVSPLGWEQAMTPPSENAAAGGLPLGELSPLDGPRDAAERAVGADLDSCGGGAGQAGLTEDYRAGVAEQRSKWGFVPGDDDTMLLELDRQGEACSGFRAVARLRQSVMRVPDR
jgi:hypothetical protein